MTDKDAKRIIIKDELSALHQVLNQCCESTDSEYLRFGGLDGKYMENIHS